MGIGIIIGILLAILTVLFCLYLEVKRVKPTDKAKQVLTRTFGRKAEIVEPDILDPFKIEEADRRGIEIPIDDIL